MKYKCTPHDLKRFILTNECISIKISLGEFDTCSELEANEGHQRGLLIVKSPRATINAVVVGVEAALPVSGVAGNAA